LPADIYVNDVKVGAVNPGEVMVFDVAPGKYTFSWTMHKLRRDSWGDTSRPSQLDLPGGQISYISADQFRTTYYMNAQAMPFLLDKDAKRLAPDAKVVRAASCPPSICI
jgi:hypothetical protein